MFKNILLAILTVLFVNTSFAQNQVIAKLKQPPANKLGIADLWSLELNNTTRKDIKGYVTGSLSEDKDRTIVEGQSKPFIIKAGGNTYTYKDFSDADIRYSNNKYKEILLRTGGAPEGDYTICVEVFSEEGDLIGIENCIYHSVRQLGNISLLTPADGDETNPDQPIIFSWTPLPDAKEYSLKVVELIGNQSPESALQQNPPFFLKENIRATQFQYPITERKFQANKSYAWVLNSNGVLSDIGTFRVKSSAIISSNELPTKYRITLMYPDGGIAESSVDNFQSELEEFARILVAEEGVKAPKKVTTPKQTQGATFGERVNEGLINFFTQEENAELGEEILILTGTPNGKTVPCPPQGCGCTDDGGESCSCKHWPGNSDYCLCQLCAIKGGGMEPIDFLPPPNNNNGITIKDILIILKKDSSQIDKSFSEIVKLGLNKVSELRRNKVESLVVKQSYKSETPKEIKYRFVLMYPENGVRQSNVDSLQNDLEEAFKEIKIEGGMPNRISTNMKVSKQTQQSSFGERVNANRRQLAENLFNVIESVTEFPFGSNIITLVAKESPCPPPGCGCTDASSIHSCQCGMWQGWCMCTFCPDKCTMPEWEVEDPVLTLRLKNTPSTKNDTLEVKDVIILLQNYKTDNCEQIKKIIPEAIDLIAAERESKSFNFSLKKKYDVIEDKRSESIYLEYEDSKFVKLFKSDITINEEGLKNKTDITVTEEGLETILAAVICDCKGEAVLCKGGDCVKCCKRYEVDKSNVVNYSSVSSVSNRKNTDIKNKINEQLKKSGLKLKH